MRAISGEGDVGPPKSIAHDQTAATSILAGPCDSKLNRKNVRQKNEGRRMEHGFVLTFASFAPSRETMTFEAVYFHYKLHILTLIFLPTSS